MELTKELYRPSEVAKLVQVSPDTIRYWIYEGKIPSEHVITLPSGHRRIRKTGVVELLQQKGIDTNKYTVVYARESSNHQKESLTRQVAQLIEWANTNGLKVDKVITDIASGMNFSRKGLREIVELAESGRLDKLIITHKDRLTRFGFDFFSWFFTKHGANLIVVNQLEEKPDSRQEIVDDFVAIIHYFTMRIYGSRHYKSRAKKLKEILDVSQD